MMLTSMLVPSPQVRCFTTDIVKRHWISGPLWMYTAVYFWPSLRFERAEKSRCHGQEVRPHLPAHEGQPLPQLGEFGSLALDLALPLSLQLAVLQARGGTVGKPLEWRNKTRTQGEAGEEKRSSGIKSAWLEADTHDRRMRYDLLLVKITLPPWDPYIYVSTDANTYTKKTTGTNMHKALPYIFPAVHPLLTSFNLVS